MATTRAGAAAPTEDWDLGGSGRDSGETAWTEGGVTAASEWLDGSSSGPRAGAGAGSAGGGWTAGSDEASGSTAGSGAEGAGGAPGGCSSGIGRGFVASRNRSGLSRGSSAPHALQNLAGSGTTVPHDAHTDFGGPASARGFPQLRQNWSPFR